jgi:hypothetical protein
MFTYFQHGRRHHPRKGSDPILGLRDVQYGYYASSAGETIVASGAAQSVFDMQGGVASAGAAALTDTPETYGLSVIAAGLGAGKHAPTIFQPGVHELLTQIDFGGSPPSEYLLEPSAVSVGSFSIGLGGGPYAITTPVTQFTVELAVGAEGPVTFFWKVSQPDGVDVTAALWMRFLRLGDQNMTDLATLL